MVELPEILFQEEKDSYDLTTKLKFLSFLAQLSNKAGESHFTVSELFSFCERVKLGTVKPS
jgi:hypothetical protein